MRNTYFNEMECNTKEDLLAHRYAPTLLREVQSLVEGKEWLKQLTLEEVGSNYACFRALINNAFRKRGTEHWDRPVSMDLELPTSVNMHFLLRHYVDLIFACQGAEEVCLRENYSTRQFQRHLCHAEGFFSKTESGETWSGIDLLEQYAYKFDGVFLPGERLERPMDYFDLFRERTREFPLIALAHCVLTQEEPVILPADVTPCAELLQLTGPEDTRVIESAAKALEVFDAPHLAKVLEDTLAEGQTDIPREDEHIFCDAVYEKAKRFLWTGCRYVTSNIIEWFAEKGMTFKRDEHRWVKSAKTS